MASAGAVNVLGIDVSDGLQARWQAWLAPALQPFFVAPGRANRWPTAAPEAPVLSAELGHTYRTWAIDRSLQVIWLDEATFLDMPRSRRAALVRAQVEHRRGAVPSVRRWANAIEASELRSQADGHRFVWWPSLVEASRGEILPRVVSRSPDGAAPAACPSRHRDVDAATWTKCARVLPNARGIAGSFPSASGPNCFATVMAAAGIAEVADDCVVQPPFLQWLDAVCRRGGNDGDPGTVLVWRDSAGDPVHAAVTIGDGWALEKASAEWWTPRAVRSVVDVVRASRARGQRLQRYHLTR